MVTVILTLTSLQCQLLNSRGHCFSKESKSPSQLHDPTATSHSKKGLSKTPLEIYVQPSALKLPLLETQD